MGKWQNGAPVDANGSTTGREGLRTAIRTYIDDARKVLEKDRDYLVEYAKRLSNRDVLEKDMSQLTAEELDKILA
jgi:hypothetical protein